MSAAECVAQLADKKTALEGVQGFETIFAGASVTARCSLFQHVPKLMEACGDKQRTVAQAAAALSQMLYAECKPWSGGYVLPLLKDP